MLRRRPGTNLIDTTRGVASDLEVGGMFVKDSRAWVVRLMLRGATTVTVSCTKYQWKNVRRQYTFKLEEKINRYLP
jgi:hypothetical protein